jgi:aspartyl/glutamyl-tRNA(Asn/Gln) amidotransferase B subunit
LAQDQTPGAAVNPEEQKMTEYEAVIGLETHIQLNTKSKIFCPCKADSWGDPPNSNICPVCSGLPGVLPVLNHAVVEKAVILAAAMHAEVNLVSYFDRKNYFYPDLPKGYQITQYDEPIGKGGYLDLSMACGYTRRVRIHKLHLEEDAGKTKNVHGQRLIDFNRCGVPDPTAPIIALVGCIGSEHGKRTSTLRRERLHPRKGQRRAEHQDRDQERQLHRSLAQCDQ